ncbi:MAG: DUF6330 family protein [bacterium]|nr:DUF6330 family protein [bacterium]
MPLRGPARTQRRPLAGITFKRGAYWWSPSEGAYPFSAALESITDQGGWIETIPNPNYRPKGLFG